jgi:hypothetical protein
MTHDRAGSGLIGSVALAVGVADAAYVATDWGSVGTGFLLGVAILVVAGALARVLRAGDPRRAPRNDLILGSLLLASVIAALALGRTAWGLLLGELAVLACLFAVAGVRAATRA